MYSNFFYSLLKLEVLNLSQNSITAVAEYSFTTLESLKVLNISGNKITIVYSYTFYGLGKAQLAELDLSRNLISTIYPIAFSELRNLTLLDLSCNAVPSLTDVFFLNLISLKTLNLNNNKIDKILPKTFEKLLMLETLDLSNNKISVYNLEMFGGVKFTGNKLKRIVLSNNRLTTFADNSFSLNLNLITLEASNNELTKLSANLLKTTTKLQKLNLNNNKLTELVKGFLDPLINVQEVYIGYNSMTFLPDVKNEFLKYIHTSINAPLYHYTTFYFNYRLQKLCIERVPFQCSCYKDLIKWSRKKKVTLVSTTGLALTFNDNMPVCVVTPVRSCVKNVTLSDEFGVAEKYNEAISLTTLETQNVHE